jgi:uncharacterized protein (TIGR02302 family)
MSTQPQPPDRSDRLIRMLRRRRALARLVLLFERLWPALWPPLGIAGGFLCAALLDLPALLPAWLHATVLALVAAAILATLARGLRRTAIPDEAAADRRLERASGLAHRPLAVLSDHPALPGAEALWKAHLARARAQIGRLRVGWPHPGLAARDPRALRGLLVVGLFASLVIAGDEAGPRLARALQPAFAPAAAAPAAQLQAWITPPAFTGLAPLFLKPAVDGAGVSVPAGSHLTVSVTGGSGLPSLILDGRTSKFQTLDTMSFQADQDLTTGGRLSVFRQGQELGAWELTVVADRAPVVSFPAPPGATRGRLPQTRLPWRVSHDYGVVSLQGELRLRDRPSAPPLIVTIPLPGGAPKAAKGIHLQDLTANPWAGLPVTARLLARDASGLAGHSADAQFDLPERVFSNPVARALMAVRKMLTLRPDDRRAPIQDLGRLAALDDVWARDLGGYVNLSAIASLLYYDRSQAGVDEAQSRLWQLALHLEEGGGERTARALEQARQALRDALDAQRRGEKIDPAEIDRRMQAVQEALNQRLQALAEQARRDGDTQQFDPEASQLDAREMQDLAERMRQAAREGRMDDARRDMAELDKMLRQLQNARPGHGPMTRQQRQRAEQRQRGQQQMSVLQDLVRREGGLLDPAQERADERADAAGPAPHADRQAAAPSADKQAAARGAEQRVQQALRRALGELMQQYGDLTGQIPPNLGDADAAMRDAGQALAAGSDGSAASAEQRAIEALQKGGQSMSQQMAQQFGRSDQDDGDGDGDQSGDMAGGDRYGIGSDGLSWQYGQSGDRRGGERRDPLGRPMQEGSSGGEDSNDTVVPDKMEAARSRAIQDELRRRGADRSRPQPELDYIDRLLQQF